MSSTRSRETSATSRSLCRYGTGPGGSLICVYCKVAYDGTNKRRCGDPAAAPKPQAAVRAALPCVHLGAAVRGDAAPDTIRDFRNCGHPEQPLGPVVCSCRGCGTSCPGYEA
ncbi:unnamed protein product [Gemmataceae bacterium]|nr:unnamed protein product [Gemmataceae bacterium]VTT98948.1 unnamed protein product [Gemmataceae bacterium]